MHVYAGGCCWSGCGAEARGAPPPLAGKSQPPDPALGPSGPCPGGPESPGGGPGVRQYARGPLTARKGTTYAMGS